MAFPFKLKQAWKHFKKHIAYANTKKCTQLLLNTYHALVWRMMFANVLVWSRSSIDMHPLLSFRFTIHVFPTTLPSFSKFHLTLFDIRICFFYFKYVYQVSIPYLIHVDLKTTRQWATSLTRKRNSNDFITKFPEGSLFVKTLRLLHPGIRCSLIGYLWPCDSRKDFKPLSLYISYFLIISLGKSGPLFWETWIPFKQGFIVPSLV